ncbi:hypothetical protein PVK06_009214 [Gossypium arboreum]|uniref:UBN2 domain-containing protein n=1 Tax=Gossypium arboreum TaxID=29729 RepID=A0ABR0QMB9_GOSAR|nr:hypothetical protein PVK06_009214 [Gossypium arboreum]
MLTTKFETLKIHESKTIGEFYVKLYDLTNHDFPLRSKYSNSKLIRKVLRSLPKRFITKVTTIDEANDIDAMNINELIEPLQTLEINMEKIKKGKLKSKKNIAFAMVEIVPSKKSIIIKEMQE